MICSLLRNFLDKRGIAFCLLLFFVSCVMDVSLFHDVSSSLHASRFFTTTHVSSDHNITPPPFNKKVVVLDFQNSDLIVLFFPFLSFLHFEKGRFGFPFPHFQFRVNNLSGIFCPLRQLHGALSVAAALASYDL